jgi:hypothetical protein
MPNPVISARKLSAAQLDGTACVICARSLDEVPSVPVEVIDGGQVFRCSSDCLNAHAAI